MKTADFKAQLELASKAKPTSNKIIRVFTQTNMACNHKGLYEIAKAEQVDLDQLELGELVVFLNNARSAMKVFAAGNVFAYMRLPEGQQIDLRTISLLPKFFSGSGINYKGMLKEQIEKALKA